MISIEAVEEMLDEIATELPIEFYRELNGGILLLPEAELHPESGSEPLYVMGQYHRSITMGRYIVIYYGSFERAYGHLTPDELREQLKRVLVHEFTHHMESLAGERGLEIKDEEHMDAYRNRS